MPTLTKSSGIAGLPEGVKEAGRRVDFRPDDFTLAIETKGYRLAWKRSCYCPCASVNDQTEQPDPNCTLCKSTGWILFDPYITPDPAITGVLTDLQKIVVGTGGVIMGIQHSIFGKDNPFDQVVRRLEGKTNISVRPENKLGYYDQLINLDTTIVYAQPAESDGNTTLKVRYPVLGMNFLRSEATVFVDGTDFQITDGDIEWLITPPAADTKLVMHYLTYPHWRVIEHPHFTRATLRKFKTATPTLPAGNPEDLPVQALCQYDFLPLKD